MGRRCRRYSSRAARNVLCCKVREWRSLPQGWKVRFLLMVGGLVKVPVNRRADEYRLWGLRRRRRGTPGNA